jgi:hypothetical protein
MIVVPTLMPLTIPDSEPTAAIPGDAELQDPPGTPSVRVVVVPAQTVETPAIGVGELVTVTVIVALQPVVAVYVITLVPMATPVVIPVDEPIVATAGVPLAHAPPGVDTSVIIAPTHSAVGPVIVGKAFTLTALVLAHPVPSV